MTDINTGIRIALLLILLLMMYLTGITFVPMNSQGAEFAKTILPYFLGLIGILFGYYWGSSSKGATQPLSPTDQAAVEAAKVKAVSVIEDAKK